MNANVMVWNDDERRIGSYAVLGATVAVVLGALAAWWFASGTPAWVYWALVGLLALVLLFMLALLFATPRASAVAAPGSTPMPEAPAPEATPFAPPAAPAYEPRVLTLRCGDCGTIFDVTDTGERPLYHTCPGCGAEGALRDPVEAPPAEATPEPAAPIAPAPAPAEAPPQSAIKKIKLRCGGCKEVFSIEDSGERPLRRACPHCGRVGQIN